jgi:pyridoxal phosphate enzyme (YggS family)
MSPDLAQNYQKLSQALADCGNAAGHRAALLAVSKTQPAEAVRACAELGQRAFGENYVQEAVAKMQALADLHLDWHLIGPLQSNKCQLVAERFAWVQTIDREKIAQGLSKFRPKALPALNVLIQINIDDEASKSGCRAEQMHELARIISALPGLRLRGLMAIPKASAEGNAGAFIAMAALYRQLQADFPGIDTLSMGMSADYALAIQHGANLIRIGSALFGTRASHKEAL